MDLTIEQQKTATLRLLQLAQLGATSAQRWDYLCAAHITGQTLLHLHWRTHWAMFKQAQSEYDWRETSGQLLRLMLVPLGHALKRLPIGNTGRSRISAFAPMSIAAHHQHLIEQALANDQGLPLSY